MKLKDKIKNNRNIMWLTWTCGKKCRELGARTTYAKNVKEVDGLLTYRRTYQKKLMELSRNPNTSEKDKKKFNSWKKAAQEKIKEFKKEKLQKKI